MNKQAIVICGPSGSGKSTLLKRLLLENKDKFAFTVSHTTRAPRAGEQDGKEYHFVTKEEMLKMINQGEFIEHTEFSGNVYGTSKRAIQQTLKSGKRLILEVDIEGVKALNNVEFEGGMKPFFIFIKPPSKEQLIARLSGRGTETTENLERRLARADDEIRFAESEAVKFDVILVNDNLEITYKKLKEYLDL